MDSPPVGAGRGRARMLAGVLGANVLFGAGLFAHAILYNFYLEGLGLRAGAMGIAAAALTAGGLSALAPAGVMLDRLGARAVYLLAALLAGGGLAGGALVGDPVLIYGAAFVAGAGTAGWRVAMGPMLMELTTPASRARIFSWNVALLLISGALWTGAAGAVPGWSAGVFGVGELEGIRIGLAAGAMGTLLSVPVLLLASGGAPAARPPAARPVGRVPPTMVLLAALVGVWMTASAMVLPFFNVYFQRIHDLTIDRVGLVLAGTQLVAALALFGSGEIAARVGPRLALAGWMVVFAPALWALGATQALPLAVTLFLLQGLVAPATNPLIDQLLLERAPADRQGAVSSWRNAATELSGLVGASSGGFLLEAGSFLWLFAVAGAVGLVGATGVLLGLRAVAPPLAAAPEVDPTM